MLPCLFASGAVDVHSTRDCHSARGECEWGLRAFVCWVDATVVHTFLPCFVPSFLRSFVHSFLDWLTTCSPVAGFCQSPLLLLDCMLIAFADNHPVVGTTARAP